VIAQPEDEVLKKSEVIKDILSCINETNQKPKTFCHRQKTYQVQPKTEDIQEWLSLT
jgi:hypothetical protein